MHWSSAWKTRDVAVASSGLGMRRCLYEQIQVHVYICMYIHTFNRSDIGIWFLHVCEDNQMHGKL